MTRNEKGLVELKQAAAAAQEALERFRRELTLAELGYVFDEKEIKAITRNLCNAGLEDWLKGEADLMHLLHADDRKRRDGS